jgi:tetratricopeptide (TPR) repeat protein
MRCLLFLVLLGNLSGQAQDLYDTTHSRRFADYLFKSGQYQLAAIELERLQFMHPSDDSLKATLVRAYSLNKSHDAALRTIGRLYPETRPLPLPFSTLCAYNLIASGKPDSAMKMLSENQLLTENHLLWYKGYAQMSTHQYKKALAQFAKTDTLPPSLLKVKTLAAEGAAIRYKSPWLAASLSMVVPGSGKFYTGEWKDALISLVTIGLTGFQAYRGFSRQGSGSTYGWIYASLGTGFYLGNIYGSFASAKRSNRRKLEKIKSKVDETFILRH